MKFYMSIKTHIRKIFILVLVGSTFLITGLSKAQQPNQESGCLECHSDKDKLSELTDGNITFIVPDYFNEFSSHQEIGCTGCHADPGGYPHPEVMGIVPCSECHSTEYTDYLNSPHGIQSVGSIQLIPKCWDCHALHPIRSSSDTLSRVHKNNEWKTCTECHMTDEDDFLTDNSRGDQNVKSSMVIFMRGIHASKIIQSNDGNSLTCRDCHGFHLLSAEIGAEWKDNFSTENDFCGKCHTSESRSFNNSIHSKTTISTVNGEVSLKCTDCHIEHEFDNTVLLKEETSSALITDNCVECHSSVNITSQFAQNARGYTEKIDSFHGIKNLHGNLIFQNCSSCHGIHEIISFKPEDGKTIASQIAENCGQCHPSASDNFTASLVHLPETVGSEDEVNVARIVMIFLVYAAMSIILITIFGDIYKAIRRKNQ